MKTSLYFIKGGIEGNGTFLKTTATLMALLNKGSFHIAAGINCSAAKFTAIVWYKRKGGSRHDVLNYPYE